MMNERRKTAEDLKVLASLASASGSHQQAMDCYLKMVELKNPVREQEKTKFAADSQANFERIMGKFKKG